MDHIGLYSVMELLIMIGWDDGLGQVTDVHWLAQEGVIPKLVAKLHPQYDAVIYLLLLFDSLWLTLTIDLLCVAWRAVT